MLKRTVLSILVLTAIQFTVSGLEKTDGRIKLEFYKNSGRFTPYFLDEEGKNEYVPFFLDKDPRTSVLNVLVGNKVYTLGDSASFRQTMQVDEDTSAFIWESKQLRITESISFLKTTESRLSDGIKITIYIENISEDDLSVGIRYLFDTWLGEKSKEHFKTDREDSMSRETDYENDIPRYWVSPSEGTDTPDLQVMTSGPGVTVPDRVVFANWSRLNDSSWTFASRSNRNFNYLPYSVNDSAVCQYYNPEIIKPGSSRTIVIVMGSYRDSGFVMSPDQINSDVSDIYAQVLAVDAEGDRVSLLRADLKAVTDLIAKIDLLISSGEEFPDAELEIIKRVLNNLKQRKEQYQR
ncbi:MAG: hypothetical protein JW874_13175 [Spirochaetales bacterium]|nr:hypothetical protein [Spirochaetales bacterium]